ncbi:helix-turn-helix domain-containing protein [Apilactobacillus quenuiae]|uniref:helix-turn-helix domain-containing protein n=1 Tax=Apilactobacillus quenuiae TaxID=2008377 RepID=UPI000D01CCDC|nr:RodZ domain-containing protein [Apilactobacillus quenuiae]
MAKDENKEVEIGKSLHDARVAKGMSLDDVQKITKIQAHYLEAIENEEFSELPGDFYVRAFIKQYADTVGIDGMELLSEHDDSLPDTQTEEYSQKVSEDTLSKRSNRQNKEERINSFRKFIPIIGTIIIVLIVVFVIWGIVAKTNKSSDTNINNNSSVSVSGSSENVKSSNDNHNKKHSKKVTSKKDVNNTTIKKLNSTEYEVSGSKNNTIKLDASNRAWSSISTNGKSLFSGSQEAGNRKAVKLPNGTKDVSMSLGNVPSTKIFINNKLLNLDKSVPMTTVLTIKFK